MKISHSARPRNRSSRSSRSPMAGSEMAGDAERGFVPADLTSTGLAVPAIVDPVTWSAMVIGGLKTLPQIATWQGVYRSGRHLAKRPDHMQIHLDVYFLRILAGRCRQGRLRRLAPERISV